MKFLLLNKISFLILLQLLLSCTQLDNKPNNQYDGSYAISMQIFGMSANSKIDLIVKGDKAKLDGKIYDCKQFTDRIEIGDKKITFSSKDGDLIINVPTIGKVKYLKLSGETNF